MFTSTGSTLRVRPGTFCRTDRRVTLLCEVKVWSTGAEAKASLNRAETYNDVDPKPCDLSMDRLKWE